MEDGFGRGSESSSGLCFLHLFFCLATGEVGRVGLIDLCGGDGDGKRGVIFRRGGGGGGGGVEVNCKP